MGKASLVIISSLVVIIIILATSLYIYSIPMNLDVQPLIKQEEGKDWLLRKITGHLKPASQYHISIETLRNDEPHSSLINWEMNTSLLGDFDWQYMGGWTPVSGNISGIYHVQTRIVAEN